MVGVVAYDSGPAKVFDSSSGLVGVGNSCKRGEANLFTELCSLFFTFPLLSICRRAKLVLIRGGWGGGVLMHCIL